ncbi:MAG: AAA family ATPase [Bacteroidota bacterium]
MDGVDSSDERLVIVLAATNTPWDLDEAIRRRLEKRVYIPLPNHKARVALFRLNMRDLDVASDLDLDDLAARTDGYSGADVANVCRDAAMVSLRRLMDAARAKGLSATEMHQELVANQAQLQAAVANADFQSAIAKVGKSVGSGDLQRFADWRRDFGAACDNSRS